MRFHLCFRIYNVCGRTAAKVSTSLILCWGSLCIFFCFISLITPTNSIVSNFISLYCCFHTLSNSKCLTAMKGKLYEHVNLLYFRNLTITSMPNNFDVWFISGWYMSIIPNERHQISPATLQSPTMKESSSICTLRFYYSIGRHSMFSSSLFNKKQKIKRNTPQLTSPMSILSLLSFPNR